MEIWKEVEGYEGFYQVSDRGNVKSLDRQTKGGFFKGYLRKLDKDKYGYWVVRLQRNGNSRTFKVHRLVALAFIDNPETRPVINHKDGNRANNLKENLEWYTVQENVQHSFDVLGKISWNKGKPTDTAHMIKYGTEHGKHRGRWLTPLGIFDTLRLAGAAHNVDGKTVWSKCTGNEEGWSVEDIV